MPGSATAEVYFIVAMMALILIICAVAVYAFARTYRKELRQREALKRAGNTEQKTDGIGSSVSENGDGVGGQE